VGTAALLAVRQTAKILADTLDAVGKLFRRSPDVQLMGPVGIVSATAEAVSRDLSFFFSILVADLAGAVPHEPAAAAGAGRRRLVFIVLAMVRRRPVNARIEAMVHGVGCC